MRILLLTHAFNSLAQRLFVELTADGHDVTIEFDVHDAVTEEAVVLWQPDLVIAPYLKRRIPESVWRRNRCLVVHPGIVGDRGPSALDWAIMDGQTRWGVTVLEANGEMDAGDVWASAEFPMRAGYQEQRLPQRGDAGCRVGRQASHHADRRRRGPRAAGSVAARSTRSAAPADAPAGSGHRLAA